jgi:cell division septation protein DedD
MARTGFRILTLAVGAALVLGGCEPGANPFSFGGKSDATDGTVTPQSTTRLVDRDVEAPEIFQVTDDGLWDGRPSLGGVWVASPDAVDPERVILRNPANGKFVIGALFRRERAATGPRLQVSSDAAMALGMVSGQPAQLNVTALRREEVPVDAPGADKPILDSSEVIEEQPLASGSTGVATSAEATQPKATQRPAPRPSAQEPTASGPAATASPAATTARSAKPYLQIGIFSVEANATRAATALRKAGALVEIKQETSHGKTFWRVIAGPATTAEDRDALLAKVKGLGFADAYFVSR